MEAMGMLNRREFLSTASRPALTMAIAHKANAAAPGAEGEWRNRGSGMAYRRLGRTGFMISEIVMGGNTISPANYEHILLALDMCLNYLDTAPAYGQTNSEKGYARVIAARKRDSFFLNTKVSLWDVNRNKLYTDIYSSLPESDQKKLKGRSLEDIESRHAFDPDYVCDYFPAQRAEMEAAALANVMAKEYGHKIDREKNYRQIIFQSLEDSLKRLGTDHVDLLMCPHGASTPYELLNHPEIFEAFEKLKQQGKVRHLGVSAHNDPAGILEAAVEAKVYSAAMVAYNIVNSRFVSKPLERANKAGLGVIAMKVARPVYNGRSNGTADDPRRIRMIEEAVPGTLKRPQKAYAWALGNPSLSAVISELVNADMVKDNLPLGAPKPGLRSSA